jgi:hypothetical protein
MARKLLEVSSIIFLVVALNWSISGIRRGIPEAWVILVVSCLVFAVVTVIQFRPLTSLNRLGKVTPENAASIEPAYCDFLATIKAYTMFAMEWVGMFLLNPRSTALFLLGIAGALVGLGAAVAMFRIRLAKLA